MLELRSKISTIRNQIINTNMKKYILTLLSFVLIASATHAQNGMFPMDSIKNPSMSLVRVAAEVGIESEYVFRGEKLAGSSIQPKVEFAYPVAGFDFYAGAWANTPFSKSNMNSFTEVDLYVGVNYQYKMMNIDLGYIYYWYTDEKPHGTMDRNQELYFGITGDTAAVLDGVNLNPSLYYFYDWTKEQHTLEFSVGYDTPVGQIALGDNWGALTFPVRVFAGYVHAQKPFGDHFIPVIPKNNYYFYCGVTADVAWAITDFCRISAGVRYSYSNNDYAWYSYIGNDVNDKSHIWWGAKVAFGF